MFACSEFPWQLYVGRDFHVSSHIKADLENSLTKKFDFIRVPLVHPRFSVHNKITRTEPMTRSDSCLSSSQWNNCIQGKLSESIDVDHPVAEVRKKWEVQMNSEMRWGIHLGVHSIVLPCPQNDSSNFSRILNSYLEKGFYYQKILVQTNIQDWDKWNNVRLKCGPSTILGVSLVVDQEVNLEVMDRWFGEPVQTLTFSRAVFVNMRDTYPTLSRTLQMFVQKMFKLKLNVLVPTCKDPEQIRGYLCYLFKNQPGVIFKQLSPLQHFSYDFWDVSQLPLQPLMHNLESSTYEIFEKDPIKYNLYEEAIFNTLVENPSFSVIMVVGAGRGPIVKAALRASRRAQRGTLIYALDKNPNAVVTLRNLLRICHAGNEWLHENVKVVESDMRLWNPEHKADIIVSELLGSFGDNELEPECLECAARLLKEGGVSIPSKAINYLTPVSSHKNWVSAVTTHASAETPYVCFPNNAYMPLESKKCFEFEYPSLDTDHSRFVELRFRPGKLVVHGFVGYFESVLHSKVLMSIKPESHSKDMGSWFPMYFPIKQPILCINHDLVVRVWRCASSDRVWYEWEVMTEKEGIMMQTSGIHNPNGKTYWIGKV